MYADSKCGRKVQTTSISDAFPANRPSKNAIKKLRYSQEHILVSFGYILSLFILRGSVSTTRSAVAETASVNVVAWVRFACLS